MSPIAIISIIALLAFAGFLAASEAALTSISRIVVEELEGKRGGALLRKYSAQPARYLNVILLVRKLCELTATVLLASIFLRNYPSAQAMALTVLIMVVVSYVVVGVGPRTLGKQQPHKYARYGIIVAYGLAFILGPVTKLLITVGNAITPGKGFRSGPFTSEAELRDLVDQAHERGLVESNEHEMIHSVFELGDTLVRELMVPRTEMVWIEKDKTLRQGLSLALRSGFSRIPVVGTGPDNIIGIVYVKDLAKRALDHHEAEQSENIEQHMRPANFIPEIKMADELLKEMQRNQIHLAVVVDEYGGTAGIITIEDIIEEIVGEIEDEFDDGEDHFTWLTPDKARANARLHIQDLAAQLKIEISESDFEDVDTIGGLMAQKLGRVPIAGSTISLNGWSVTSERPLGRRRRISSVLIERLDVEIEDHE
ncbi:MAG: hemolysin family protein [Candidatus Planktophila sp.]|nr:hemolysin family protein [Candidatus Planktophila sp.]